LFALFTGSVYTTYNNGEKEERKQCIKKVDEKVGAKHLCSYLRSCGRTAKGAGTSRDGYKHECEQKKQFHNAVVVHFHRFKYYSCMSNVNLTLIVGAINFIVVHAAERLLTKLQITNFGC
jgi:hypothetical protein